MTFLYSVFRGLGYGDTAVSSRAGFGLLGCTTIYSSGISATILEISVEKNIIHAFFPGFCLVLAHRASLMTDFHLLVLLLMRFDLIQ